MNGLQSFGAEKRRYCKENENYRDGQGSADEPGRGVASPSAKGGINPHQSQDGEYSGDYFVKHLLEGAPEMAEATGFLRSGRGGGGRHGYRFILPQNEVAS